ncbi:MAG: flavodoxin [Clostridia bacterium]|nr:flavodoxin [Clostridia bacterium]
MKKLVVCFSYGGTTLAKAEQLAKEHAADLFELKAKVPYTAADVNWQDNASRNVKEQNDKSSRPEIELLPDLSGVDELWLGYPIWWYTHPRIINTFLDQADLLKVRVHLFATSGGTGIEGSLKELKETYPSVDFADAVRL